MISITTMNTDTNIHNKSESLDKTIPECGPTHYCQFRSNSKKVILPTVSSVSDISHSSQHKISHSWG